MAISDIFCEFLAGAGSTGYALILTCTLSLARKMAIINLIWTILGINHHFVGYNHSGKGGKVNFLNGVMGMANAQRALNYIRIFTEFISQPQYKDLVPMFSIMNEPLRKTIGVSTLTSL